MPSPTQPTERRSAPAASKPPTPVTDNAVEAEVRRLAGYVLQSHAKIEQMADDAAFLRKMLRNKVMWGVCVGMWVFFVTFVLITFVISLVLNEPVFKYYFGW